MQKTAEERFNMLARGWLAYPVTPTHAHLPPKCGCRNDIPRLANNLYNRSSAVDPSFHNQPQVGKPTWGYNYPTALRRLPSVIGHHPHPQKTATIGLPSPLKKTPSIGLRQRRGASPSRKTAEERFHMLARGWLAYPVTSMHSQLPPKSGCRNPIPRLANNLYNRSSAVDSSFHNQPQVGEPTWGYDYTTALRRLPCANGRHLQKRHPSSATIHIRKKNAEERL